MALFTDRLDQSRQAERIQRVGVTGKKARQLRQLGYNEFGEKTAWGKVMGTINPLGDAAARKKVQGITKGTQTGDSIKESNNEYFSAKGSHLKFGAEAAKTLIGLGGLEGLGGLSGSATDTATSLGDDVLSNAAGNVSPEAMGSGLDMSSVLGNTDSVTGIGSAATNAPSLSTPGISNSSGSSLETLKSAMDSDIGQQVLDMQERSDIADAEDELEDDIKNEIKKTKKEEVDSSKTLNKIKDVANIVSPLVASGIDVYQKNKAFGDEEDRIRKKNQSRKVMANYNLL